MGELKKTHKHGVFFFDSLKSYKQVSELIKDKLNGPAHVEVVQSSKGLFDYVTHAENKDKTQYDVNDIEVGCSFNLDKFLVEMNFYDFLQEVVDIIERTYFFAKYLDSRRYSPQRHQTKKGKQDD